MYSDTHTTHTNKSLHNSRKYRILALGNSIPQSCYSVAVARPSCRPGYGIRAPSLAPTATAAPGEIVPGGEGKGEEREDESRGGRITGF